MGKKEKYPENIQFIHLDIALIYSDRLFGFCGPGMGQY